VCHFKIWYHARHPVLSVTKHTMASNDKTEFLKVWDLPTRFFHWSLLLLIVASWWTSTENGDMDIHMKCGYAVLALLLFRVIWGFAGSTTARFSSFVGSPRSVLDYLAATRRNESTQHIGHNPAGGWMVVMLLGMLLLITSCGLFANDDMMTEGPLAQHVGDRISDLATALHEQGFYLLLALVALHISAVLFYLLVKKENLVRPMLTGVKQMPQGAELPVLHTRSVWLALVILGLTSGIVCLLAKFA
jgi:cytochrome b